MRIKCRVFGAPREPEVLFKLEECFDTVQLVVCDSEGNMLPNGNILSIKKDGSLRTFDSVGNNLGLKLDCDGRIIIDND